MRNRKDKASTGQAGASADLGEAGFRSGAVVLIVVVAGLLFLVALYAMLSERAGPDQGDRRAPSSTGVTSIGLGAYNALLGRLDFDVQSKAGHAVARRAKSGGVVIVSDVNDPDRLREVRKRFKRSSAVLVLLPKWRIPWFTFGRRFAEAVWPVALVEPESAVRTLLELGSSTSGESFKLQRGDGDLGPLALNLIGPSPSIEKPQLMREGRLIPIIATEDGAILLAEIPTPRDDLPALFVLSDPDPLLNHGLDNKDNALFAIRLVEWLGGENAPVAFDDGPGAPRTPASFWFSLFQPPLIAITFSIVALFLALGLLAIARFGSRSTDRPGQAAGKEALLDAASALLRQGNGDRVVIRRFFEETLRDVARALQAPKFDDSQSLIHWLRQAERMRRVSGRVEELNSAVESAERGSRPRAEQLTELAQDINAWREEMLRGHA